MTLRKHVIQAVFKRNFQSYFAGILGYLFIVAFVALGAFLAFNPQFFANNLANLDQLNAVFPMLLLFFVPAITMNAWADERRQGTDELLFTLPASDVEILLGKYFAVLGVYTVALLFSLSHVFVLVYLGGPDWGLMLTTYFGYWMVGAALLSAGMVASILTSSAAVGYVLGSLICAVPVFIDKLPVPATIENLFSLQRLLQGLSVSEQFKDFGLGMIPLGGLLYFLSLTVIMLYLNLVLISRRHWSGGPQQSPMGLHYLVRAAALAAILISANAVAANVTRRIDMTSERLYSLSPTTSDVLKKLNPDRPVLIQAFISPEVPREYAAARSNLIGLLRQYDQTGGNKVRVRIVSTEKFSDAADEAKRYGIEPNEVQSERAGRAIREDVFLGVVVTATVDDQVIIPFVDKGTPLEYELTRSIRTVSKAERKKLGILRTDAQISGGFDMQAFRPLPEWRIVTELKKQYDVKVVSPDELATSDRDVLLAVMPSSLTDPEMDQLINYVKTGKPTLIVDDPFPIFQPGLAPRSPKPRPGGGGMNAMFGGGQPSPPKADNGEARRLCELLGIAWKSDETVWDNYDAHPELRERLAATRLYNIVCVTPANKARYAFSQSDGIAKDLQEVMLFYPGQIKRRENSKLDFEPLLRSSPGSVTHEWDDYVKSGPMGGMALVPPPEKKLPKDPLAPVIAAHITGSVAADKDSPKDGDSSEAGGGKLNVVFIADMDMIADPFFFIRDSEWQGLRVDNIALILNAVDALAGDETFLELRSRRPKHQTLSTVEQQVLEARNKESEASAKADEKAKTSLDEAQKRLKEEADKIRNDKTLDRRTSTIKLASAQENEQRRFTVEKASIENTKNKEIKQIKGETEREVRRIESQIRWFAFLIPPIPAVLLGVFVFAARARDERQGIIPDRLVGK